MTRVLGYDTYAVHGTDWGADVAYSLYAGFNATVRAGHFAFVPFFPLTPAQLAAEGVTLGSSLEEFEAERFLGWSTTGNGYFVEQTTKVPMMDNPLPPSPSFVPSFLLSFIRPWEMFLSLTQVT